MRGFRLVGVVNEDRSVTIREEVHESDVVFFSPHRTGERMRAAHLRMRDLAEFTAFGFFTRGDHVFVATAIGEDCFK